MRTDLKTMRNFTVTIFNPMNNKPSKCAIDGYKVVISGFEEYSFFVHRYEGSDWQVSEESTGFSIPSYCDGATRISAINKATELLKKTGKEKLATIVQKAKDVIAGKIECPEGCLERGFKQKV